MTVLTMPPMMEWSPEALESLPSDYRYEVREGNLVVIAAAMRPWHGDTQRRVCNVLVGQGRHAYPEQGITLGIGEIRTCDVGVYKTRPIGDAAYRPASDFELIVEIVSDSSRREDREVKPMLYAAAGIAEYWRVEEDTDGAAIIHQHVLGEDGAYVERNVVTLAELEAEQG